MTDFHSHILPGIDDGSRDVSQSLEMLRELRRQGVDSVALTPHFYAGQQDPDHFLERRARAYEQLREQWEPDLPDVRLGAEVFYFRGVSHSQSLPALCLEGTSLLLLEMPFGTWTPSEVEEVLTLARQREVTVLLAHIDRYWFDQKWSVWEKLLGEGVLFQVNTGAFQNRRTRRQMLKLIAAGFVYALGTDCHDTADRAPNLSEAREIILRRLGEASWARLCSRTFDDEP